MAEDVQRSPYAARAVFTREHYSSLVSFYRTEIEDIQGRARSFLTLTLAIVGGKIVGWMQMNPHHPDAQLVHTMLISPSPRILRPVLSTMR